MFINKMNIINNPQRNTNTYYNVLITLSVYK